MIEPKLPGLPEHARQRPWMPEALVLGVLFLGLAWLIVPSHWTSIWMDREFTGWVAPVANRLAQGDRLYTDGTHSPMPPLPAILLRIATGGAAKWIHESAMIVALQAGMLLLGYATFRRVLRWPAPFLATLAAMPLVFAFRKTIAYDALAQFWVAALGLLVVLRTEQRERRRTFDLGLGLVTALLLLTKQSTAVGAIVGTIASLILFDDSRWRKAGWISAVSYVLATTACFIALTAVLSPFFDWRGMLTDVFATGSEPKGGVAAVQRNLAGYARVIVRASVSTTGVVVLILLAWRWWAQRTAPATAPTPPARSRTLDWLWATAILSPLGAWLLVESGGRPDDLASLSAERIRETVLWAGLLASLALAGLRFLPRGGGFQPLLRLLPLLFCSAVFHNLSVSYFRWTYDNNPLVPLVLAGVIAFFLDWLLRGPGWKGGVALVGLSLLSLSTWMGFAEQWQACRACTESWPECTHLAGARLRPGAQGMRLLVERLRQYAPNATQDAVLLLPNDPNVEAWFERPRPPLSSLIVFADQYWDKYVEADLERLRRDPPTVIVIGPRNSWRPFHRQWNENYGCERLIDLVRGQLLPEKYVAVEPQRIEFGGREDFMDIYVRRSAAADSVSAGR